MKKLISIAYARSGDKGSCANIGVAARREEDYPLLINILTEERVQKFFQKLQPKKVTRYTLANLHALNFVLEGILHGGGASSLAIDSQGKTLAQALLTMDIEK